MDELQPRSNGWIFHSAGLMQSGSAENAAPPSLQPQNKACNYCYFPFIHLSILPTSGSIPHSPDSLHACLLLSALPSPSAPSVSSLHFPSPPSIPPQLCPSLPPSVPLLPLTSSVMSHLCGGSGEPLSLSFFFWPRYFPIHHHVCFPHPPHERPTSQYGHDDAQLLWQIELLISL